MSVYSDTIRERVLTPQALEDVQRAAQLLRASAPVVKEALDLLAPIERQMDDTALEILEAGHDISDEDGEAVRAGVYREALDLAFAVLYDAQRITLRT